jgi:hypothetical protein
MCKKTTRKKKILVMQEKHTTEYFILGPGGLPFAALHAVRRRNEMGLYLDLRSPTLDGISLPPPQPAEGQEGYLKAYPGLMTQHRAEMARRQEARQQRDLLDRALEGDAACAQDLLLRRRQYQYEYVTVEYADCEEEWDVPRCCEVKETRP